MMFEERMNEWLLKGTLALKGHFHNQIRYVLQSNDNPRLYIGEGRPISKGRSESSECYQFVSSLKHSPYA